jgi:flagellar hook assembly protein FlgD
VLERCFVALEVIDVSGALMARLVEGYREKGAYSVSWNGRDVNGRKVSSGVYFYRLRAGKQELSRKMVLAR